MKYLALFLISVVNLGYVNAKEYRFSVVDEQNQPLANTIIKVSTPLLKSSASLSSNDLAIMDQINKQFSPYVLLVNAGQLVSFPNRDDIRHHVYSFSKAKPFEIRLYKSTPSEPVEFNQAGIVELGCNIHDRMIGYIYVSDTDYTVKTNAKGQASISVLDKQTLTAVELWHPSLSTSRTEHIERILPQPNELGEYVLKLSLMAKEEKKTNNSFKRKFGQ
ncbi:MAG: methylamine utilization protein [Thalassotalea sp.]